MKTSAPERRSSATRAPTKALLHFLCALFFAYFSPSQFSSAFALLQAELGVKAAAMAPRTVIKTSEWTSRKREREREREGPTTRRGMRRRPLNDSPVARFLQAGRRARNGSTAKYLKRGARFHFPSFIFISIFLLFWHFFSVRFACSPTLDASKYRINHRGNPKQKPLRDAANEAARLGRRIPASGCGGGGGVTFRSSGRNETERDAKKKRKEYLQALFVCEGRISGS